MKKYAFTLAEVLITLVIIGVIAALTIPNLMKHYKKQEIETMLKQNYNLVQNAFTLARAEYGDPSGWDKINQPNMRLEGRAFFEKYLIRYMKVDKKAQTLREIGYRTPIYYMNGTVFRSLDDSNNTKYVLSNGSVITDIGSWTYENSNDESIAYVRLIDIDLNGSKGPNTKAKDIFRYVIPLDGSGNVGFTWFNFNSSTGTFTYWSNLKREAVLNYCKGNDVTMTPIFCGKLIQMNGWKIPDDYPYKF